MCSEQVMEKQIAFVEENFGYESKNPICSIEKCGEEYVVEVYSREHEDEITEAVEKEFEKCEITFTYQGEYTHCSECWEYDTIESFFVDNDNGVVLCANCVDKDINEYVEYHLNDPKRAILYKGNLNLKEELEELGFVKLDEEYENGLYGTYDDPKFITKNIREKHGNDCDILFVCDSVNPFAVYFSSWIRYNCED